MAWVQVCATTPVDGICQTGLVWMDQASAIGVDAASIQAVYEWGFSVIVSAWAVGMAVGIAISLIRKV